MASGSASRRARAAARPARRARKSPSCVSPVPERMPCARRALAPTAKAMQRPNRSACPHLLDEPPAQALFGNSDAGIKRLWSAFHVASIERLAACKGFALQARPWRKHFGLRLLALENLQVQALSRALWREKAGARGRVPRHVVTRRATSRRPICDTTTNDQTFVPHDGVCRLGRRRHDLRHLFISLYAAAIGLCVL